MLWTQFPLPSPHPSGPGDSAMQSSGRAEDLSFLATPSWSASWTLFPTSLTRFSFPSKLLQEAFFILGRVHTVPVSPHPLSSSFQFHWFVVQITPVPEMLTWVDTFSSLLGVLVLGSGRYLINATHGTLGHKSCFVQAGVPAHEMTPLCG